jgi:hypothetical protein
LRITVGVFDKGDHPHRPCTFRAYQRVYFVVFWISRAQFRRKALSVNPARALPWPFQRELDEITSTAAATDRQVELLETLGKGSRIIICDRARLADCQ